MKTLVCAERREDACFPCAGLVWDRGYPGARGSQVEDCVPSALSGSFRAGWNEAKSKGCSFPLTLRSADSPLTCYTGRVRICRGLKTQSH